MIEVRKRWKMNRIGFVNFWLYDEQEFPFVDGKLLLRGANGSGKSITTQSFIPFILDGNKSPERLDPFGSRDRKMDYYMLDCRDREVGTGYLYMEFKQDGEELYRTIGIGLKAQKGKPMAFWGFCLKDGRRVGYDFFLYKEAGDKKIPLAKGDLKKLVEAECFAESSSAYMEMVNRYIFGFQRLEQYDQFIRLLIKVRAPKLSKEFTPSKVYEILNSSLQTLSNDDLRAMVDAMENLDDIQSRLETYRQGLKDATTIKREYDRYNQYMLGQKAGCYQQVRTRVKKHFKLMEDKSKEQQSCEEKLAAAGRRQTENIQEKELLMMEKTAMADVDLSNGVEKLKLLLQDIADFQGEISREKEELESQKERQDDTLRQAKAEEESLEIKQDELAECLSELADEQEYMLWEKYDAYVEAVRQLAADEETAGSDLRSYEDDIAYIKAEVEKGIEALTEKSRAAEQYDEAEQIYQESKIQRDKALERKNDADQLEDEERDRLIEKFYHQVSLLQELPVGQEELKKITAIITRYQGIAEDKELQDLLADLEAGKKNQLINERAKIAQELEQSRKSWREAEAELERLKAEKDVLPVREDKTAIARKALEKAGIPYKAFYEIIDFGQGLSDGERNLLEEQLWDAGILDSLVLPEKWQEKGTAVLADYSDKVLLPQKPVAGAKAFDKLVPETGDEAFATVAKSLLACFSSNKEPEALAAFSADGYYRHGLLSGHSAGNQEAAFIGIQARKRKRERLIAAQEQVVEGLLAALEEQQLALSQVDDRLRLLAAERGGLPGSENLLQAVVLSEEAQHQLKRAEEELAQKETWRNQKKEIVLSWEQQVISICKGLPYRRRLDAYKEADQGLLAGQKLMQDISRGIERIFHARALWRKTRESIEQLEAAVDACWERISKTERNLKRKEQEKQQLDDFLNKPENIEKRKRFDEIQSRLLELEAAIRSDEGVIGSLTERVKNGQEELLRLKQEQEENIVRENQARKYYQEELSLGFVIKADEGTEEEQLQAALERLKEGDALRTPEEMYAALNKNFQQHSSNLASYQPMLEECFAGTTGYVRQRFLLRFSWDGQKFSLYDFIAYIKDIVTTTELLILEEDRKLFEDILADTLVQKLYNRIVESRRWIKNMSRLMQEMDTSMGLSFSLDWKGRSKANEDELDTAELERLFSRDRSLLTDQDKEKVSRHFRIRIQNEKRILEEEGKQVDYADLVRDALDYRQWFEFRMFYIKREKGKKELTNSAFNQFSGGEKAMAMYVPLFAAVSAQYQMANQTSPYIIALDEAFAGVDDQNISVMFNLVECLKFDYIMNSQALWGCYETVKALSICELQAFPEEGLVFAVPYLWNGKVRSLNMKEGVI